MVQEDEFKATGRNNMWHLIYMGGGGFQSWKSGGINGKKAVLERSMIRCCEV